MRNSASLTGGTAQGESDVQRAEPVDALARRRITDDLSQSMMVMAGAGAGKTYSMVERLVQDVLHGATMRDIWAITFTRKAAAEMRDRFLSRIAALPVAEPSAPGAADTAGQAALSAHRKAMLLANSHQANISTIHGFCGSILRLYPTEAGISPTFRTADEVDMAATERAFWRAVVGEMPADIQVQFDRWGISRRDLFEHFKQRWHHRDLTLVNPSTPPPKPEAWQPLWEEAVALARALIRFAPRTVSGAGDKKLSQWVIATVGAAEQIASSETARPSASGTPEDEPSTSPLVPADATDEPPADVIRLLGMVANYRTKDWLTQKTWNAAIERLDASAPKLKPYWEDQLDDFAARLSPLIRTWQAYVHTHVQAWTTQIIVQYERYLADRGILSFDDLLIRTRNLLVAHPDVRRALFARIPRLVVDEFQDTDPLQAEIMLLLTDPDTPAPAPIDTFRPHPGRLFVVGDAKQSIYRFRRADFETVQQVRRAIEATPSAEVLSLTTSFRSRPGLCEWINRAMAPLFPAEATSEQTMYTPLAPQPAWVAQEPPTLQRVHRLLQPHESASRKKDQLLAESEAFAQIVEILVGEDLDAKKLLLGADPDRVFRDRTDQAAARLSYADILILTYNTKTLAYYADALTARNIPSTVSGAGALGSDPVVRALITVVSLFRAPSHPYLWAQYLLSPFGGCREADLASLRFDSNQIFPQLHAAAGDAVARRLRSALERVSRAFDLIGRATPADALLGVLDLMSAWELAASSSKPRVHLGNVMRLRACIASWGAAGMTLPAVMQQLSGLATEKTLSLEEMSLDSAAAQADESGNAVRVMNLHKAKGLQARVVLLSGYHRRKDPSPALHVDRTHPTGTRVYIPLIKSSTFGGGGTVLAAPPDWPQQAEKESEYLKAEGVRLLYVALTRAADWMVVGGKYKSKGDLDFGAWQPVASALADVPDVVLPSADAAKGQRPRGATGAEGAAESDQPFVYPHTMPSVGTWSDPSFGVDNPSEAESPDAPPKRYPAEKNDGAESTTRAEIPSPIRDSESARKYGTALHQAFEYALRCLSDIRGDDIERLAEKCVQGNMGGRSPEEVSLLAGMIVQAWQDFSASEVGEAAYAAHEAGRQVLVETPLVAPKTPPAAVAAGAIATGAIPAGAVPTGAISKETIPTAWRGVIDLLIETPQGWWLVDYKTNEHTTAEMLRSEYDAQLRLYRQALQMTRPRMRVWRTSLWSTSLKCTIDIDRED